MSSAVPLGRFIWYELLTLDPPAAVPFYRAVTGWGTQVWEEGVEPYTMYTVGEQPVAGTLVLPDDARKAGAPPHWLGYVSTPDVDVTATAVEQGGGIIHHRMQLPKVGSFVIAGDPDGAVFAAFTPEHLATETPVPPPVGHFSWHELATTDHEATFDFYQRVFGWEKADAMDMGESGIYQMFGVGGTPMGGIFNRPPEMPVSMWLYYAKVRDVHRTADVVTAHGGKLVNGPTEVPGGDLVAQCTDPQGAAFALHSTAG